MNQRAQELQPVAQTGRANQPVLIPPDGRRLSPFIPRGSNRFRDLYHRRGAVERELGRLKNHYGLAPLRVRGLERVQLTPTSACSRGSRWRSIEQRRWRSPPE